MSQEHEKRVRPGFVVGGCSVVAAVAIAIWWLLAPTASRQTGTTTPVAISDYTTPQERTLEHGALKPQLPLRAPLPTVVTTNVGTGQNPMPSSIAALLGAIPVTIERKTGKGDFTGQVKTFDGQPLANVKVTAILQERSDYHYSRQNSTKQEDPSLEDLVTETIRAHRQQEANKHEAQTDANGTYTMAELADADYTMTVSLPESVDVVFQPAPVSE